MDDVVRPLAVFVAGNVGEADIVLAVLGEDGDGGALDFDGGFLGFAHGVKVFAPTKNPPTFELGLHQRLGGYAAGIVSAPRGLSTPNAGSKPVEFDGILDDLKFAGDSCGKDGV